MWRYGPSIRGIIGCILDGVFDSLRLPSTLIFFLSSVTVRVRTAHCLVLNGVIFLGSILMADFVMAPTLRAMLAMGGISTGDEDAASAGGGVTMPLASASIPLPTDGLREDNVGEWMNVVFLYAYQLLWIYPLYAISFILNAIWYQDIADHAFVTHGGASQSKSITFQKWVSTMSDEVYRLLLVSAYMVQLTIVSLIPFGIGDVLAVVHLCWMYSLYSFEYKWSLLGWSLEYRLKYFEHHWAYFLGFGLPAVSLTLLFPKFISLGIFALAFPIFIILAIIARPTTHAHTKKTGAALSKHAASTEAAGDRPPVLLAHLPIFRMATWLNWRILSQLQRRSKNAARRTSTAGGAQANAIANAAAAAAKETHADAAPGISASETTN